jgi:uncharacterized repeat protein (TIGR03803 family)
MSQPVYTLLHTLPTTGRPGGRLILDAKGNIYGTTGAFRQRFGSVFELRRVKLGYSYKLLYRFSGGADGANPWPGLVRDSAGNLYGAAEEGGPAGRGVVFKLTPTLKGQWTEQIVFSFSNVPAHSPSTGLIADAAGNLYGATLWGGPNFYDGTVFRLRPQPDGSWTFQSLYTFTSNNTFGMNAQGPLTMDTVGNLYGVTLFGGSGTYCPDMANECGTAFQLTATPSGSWTYNLLYSFCSLPGCADGQNPIGMTPDNQGNIFGTAYNTNGGIAFELSPGTGGQWSFDVIHQFCSLPGCADGKGASGAPIIDAAGNLFGPSSLIYELSPNVGDWNFTDLHDFCQLPGCTDGSSPTGELTFDSAGNLYGTTWNGVVFRLTP